MNTKYCPSRPSQPKRPPRHGHPIQHPYPSCRTDNGDISNPPFSPAQKLWLAQPAYGDCHACGQDPGILPVPAVFIPLIKSLLFPVNCHSFKVLKLETIQKKKNYCKNVLAVMIHCHYHCTSTTDAIIATVWQYQKPTFTTLVLVCYVLMAS